jgi:hypothetical protein
VVNDHIHARKLRGQGLRVVEHSDVVARLDGGEDVFAPRLEEVRNGGVREKQNVEAAGHGFPSWVNT